MKLPQYFKLYNYHRTNEYLLSSLLLLCSFALGKRLIEQIVLHGVQRASLFGVGIAIALFCGSIVLFMRAHYSRWILFGKEGVIRKNGTIAYSQYSYLRASFAYQQITLVRSERAKQPIALQFPSGHEGRKKLYALSAKSNIPVQEDYFSSQQREPDGKLTGDPRSDLQEEIQRQDLQKNKWGVPLQVKRSSKEVRISTPFLQEEKLTKDLLSMLALGIGLWFVYIFVKEIRVIDIWVYNLGIAIPGSWLTVMICLLIFGFPIVESFSEKVEISIRSDRLRIKKRRGFFREDKSIELPDVFNVVIQQVGWSYGYGVQSGTPVFDCIVLTERETISLGLQSRQCHQLQGLVLSALDDFRKGDIV